MIKIENAEVFGWEHAIRGMRNPLNSWHRSDSGVDCTMDKLSDCLNHDYINCDNCREFKIGPNDLDLMNRLRNAGTDHRKFMRMITVYLDITAPLYWWKEFDTYKVGTVANSCSTMHKIHDKEFTLDDFSCEHLFEGDEERCHLLEAPLTEDDLFLNSTGLLKLTMDLLNAYRNEFLRTKDKKYWWQMIQLLPSSYNQKRTIMLNYEVLANMCRSRRNHKLDEWRDFYSFVKTLPYSEIIIGK